MLTFEPSRQLSTHAPAELEARPRPARNVAGVATFDDPVSNDLVARAGVDGNRSWDSTSIEFDASDIHRLLMQDLDVADAAIADGRINDAHDALIHAQDIAFDIHYTLCSAGIGRRRSTAIPLQLTNRLIDANRTKDRAILAECRSLVGLLAEVDEPVGPAPNSGTNPVRSAAS